jgi:hypothetical protein
MEPGPWSWLEVAKLAVSFLTPAMLAGVGIYIHRITKRFDHAQWRGQKLIEKRLAVYDEMAPLLNDLLGYFTYVGAWRDFDPPAIVSLKRTIDKKIHLSAPLFGSGFFGACMDLKNLCFETYRGWGQDAKLRTNFERRQQSRPNDWKAEWDALFSNAVSEPAKIRSAYKRVMEVFAEDIGVHSTFTVPPPGRVLLNIE